MRAVLIYITEYAETQRLMEQNRFCTEDLLVRWRAIFGCVDRIRNQIDKALQHDDAHRRRRDMRMLIVTTRFPSPEVMVQGDVTISQGPSSID